MDGVVIDERRVHVDFSQSVAKLWYNFKKAQNMSRAEDKNNELILPNENQKLEIKANKEFMVNKGSYKMVFEETEENSKYRPFTEKPLKRDKETKKEKKETKKKSRSNSKEKSRHKKKNRSRSRERKHVYKSYK